jgi:hypothetical protein
MSTQTDTETMPLSWLLAEKHERAGGLTKLTFRRTTWSVPAGDYKDDEPYEGEWLDVEPGTKGAAWYPSDTGDLVIEVYTGEGAEFDVGAQYVMPINLRPLPDIEEGENL